MKNSKTVLIIADLEGIYGVYDLKDVRQCKRAYLDELSAYVTAFLDNGIRNIVVCDAHDNGTLLCELPASFKNANIKVVSTIENIKFDQKYDFSVLVGFHGMHGSPGVLPHSIRFNFERISVFSRKLNEYVPIGEVEIYMRWLGSKGIPVILVTGDREAVYEGNCFNPYRETCCVKSLYEISGIIRTHMFDKIHNSVSSALKLDYRSCVAEDVEDIYFSFIHEDVIEWLSQFNYSLSDNSLIFNSCSSFVDEMYTLIDRLIEFDKSVIESNKAFMRELRKITTLLDRSVFEHSEVGKLLSRHTLYSLNHKAKETARAYFKSIERFNDNENI